MKDMEQEIWKAVVGYEGIYLASSFGRVKRVERWVTRPKKGKPGMRGRLMKPMINKWGYVTVHLTKGAQPKTLLVHRIIAKAFLKNPESKQFVNHKDFNTQNNNIGNLEWVTRAENMKHAVENMRHLRGEKHQWAKITEDDVRHIRKREMTQREYQALYGIDHSCVCRIQQRKTWKHIA